MQHSKYAASLGIVLPTEMRCWEVDNSLMTAYSTDSNSQIAVVGQDWRCVIGGGFHGNSLIAMSSSS